MRASVEDDFTRECRTDLSGDQLHASRERQGVPEISHSSIVVDGGQIHVQFSHGDIRRGVACPVGHHQAKTGQLAVAVQVVFLA